MAEEEENDFRRQSGSINFICSIRGELTLIEPSSLFEMLRKSKRSNTQIIRQDRFEKRKNSKSGERRRSIITNKKMYRENGLELS